MNEQATKACRCGACVACLWADFIHAVEIEALTKAAGTPEWLRHPEDPQGLPDNVVVGLGPVDGLGPWHPAVTVGTGAR